MYSLSRSLIVPAVVVGWLFTAGLATAAAVAEIRDDGGFFKADTIRQANKVIRELKEEHKIDLFIQTYKDIPDDLKKDFDKVKKDKKERDAFFEKWARQRAKEAEVNGIYILLLHKGDDHPGHLQIEVGDQTRKKAFTIANRDKLDEIFLAKLKDPKTYDEGLLDTVKYVRDTVDANLGKEKAHAAPGQVDSGEGSTLPAKGLLGGIGGIICIGLVILLVVWVVFALIRAFSRMGGGGGGYGPGYGGGGYGGGYGGGGGFMSGMLGGMFGAAAGSWMYDRFFRGDSSYGGGGATHSGGGGADYSDQNKQDTDYSGTGGDFGGDQGDAGGGGDFGGGDAGGDAGGDLGGGGFFGGGDAGGGGDFGGGGGDFGGGGGGDF